MSVQAIGWALGQTVGSASAKSVLVAIANYADENGRCWPSQQRLAADTELTDRSIRTALQLLEENSFIRRVERRRPDGSRTTDEFQIIYRAGANSTPPENISAPPENGDGKAETISPPPEGVSGLTTFEPSVNHQEPVAREPAQDSILAKLKTDIVKSFSAAKSMTLVPDTHRAERWLAQGYDPALILATIREMLARKPNVKTLAYFDNAIADAHKAKAPPIAKPIITDDKSKWAGMLKSYAAGSWSDWWGPPPGSPGCRIPSDFIAEHLPPSHTEAA